MNAKKLQEILSDIFPVSLKTAESLLLCSSIKQGSRGDVVEKNGQKIEFQFIVMEGVVRKYILNNDADEFSLDFFRKGQAVTPSLMRSSNFVSFVNLDIVSAEAEILLFHHDKMEQNMSNNQDLKAFGHHVMMQDSRLRAEREIILLTADGKEKLNWFRTHYPNLENEIPHYYIASFLGLTKTSLSRLRKNRGI